MCCERSECVDNPDGKKIENASPKTGNRSLQYLAVFSVSLVTFGCGTVQTWASPALSHLRSNNSEFTITPNQGSWIASLDNIGAVSGLLLYPLLVDRIGRKYVLLIFALPQTISWIMIFFAKNVIHLYLARIVSGIGYGGAYSVVIMFIGEIADKDIRGFLVSISRISVSIGNITTLAAGAFLSYETMNLTLLFIPIIFFVTFIFIPESPYFYLKHKRKEDAAQSLSEFRGTKDSKMIDMEMSRMKEVIIEEEQCEKGSLRMLFTIKRHRKALIILAVAHASEVFGGLRTIASYTEDIFSYGVLSSSTSILSPKYAALTLTVSATIIMIPLAPLIDYVGRRYLLLVCSIVCSLSLIIVGLFFFLRNYLNMDDLSSVSWLPLIGLIVFKIAIGLGLVGTAIVLQSEIFSIQVKSQAVSLVHIVQEFMAFITKLTFERSVDTFGIYGVLWLYALSCFVFPFIAFHIMPETKGKTLEDIQILLN